MVMMAMIHLLGWGADGWGILQRAVGWNLNQARKPCLFTDKHNQIIKADHPA
jgi:hypothetical protein